MDFADVFSGPCPSASPDANSALRASSSASSFSATRVKELCAATFARAKPSIVNACRQAWTNVRTGAQELFESVCSKRKRGDSTQQLLRDPRPEDKTLSLLAENIYDNLTDWGDMTRDQFVSKMLTIAALQDEYPIALNGDCAQAVIIYRDDVLKKINDKEQQAKQLDELQALIDVDARLVKRRHVESGRPSNDHDMPDGDHAHVLSMLKCLQKLEENKQVFEERFGKRFAQPQDASNADAVDAASNSAAVDAAIADAVERNLQQPQPAEPHSRTLFVSAAPHCRLFAP